MRRSTVNPLTLSGHLIARFTPAIWTCLVAVVLLAVRALVIHLLSGR